MSKYYRPQRVRNLYDPAAAEPYPLSRSKLDLFLNCPRCFYVDRRLGIGQPPGFPFSLNSAVDALLKKEFDHFRTLQKPHPLLEKHGIDAIPYAHEKLEEWRDSLRRGIRHFHAESNFVVTGGIDDLWINSRGELIVVDYKATAKLGEVGITADWQIGYRRQMSLYVWLFRKNGFSVSDTAYFVYCNGKSDRPFFDGKLEFDISVIPYKVDESWIELALANARTCLSASVPPNHGEDCDHCLYIQATSSIGGNGDRN